MVQIDDVVDERGLYRYVTQSSMVFGQAVFTKACEDSGRARRSSGDDRSFDEGDRSSDRGDPHQTGLLAETVADAMAAGMRDNIIDFDVLEEAAER